MSIMKKPLIQREMTPKEVAQKHYHDALFDDCKFQGADKSNQ
jgi:hypothetical protein